MFSDTQDAKFLQRQIAYGQIQRSFEMPTDAICEKAQASFSNGILKLEIPKSLSVSSNPRVLTIDQPKGEGPKNNGNQQRQNN